MDEHVYLRNTAGGAHKWVPVKVVRQTGPVSYHVKERDSPELVETKTETVDTEIQTTGNDASVEITVGFPVQPPAQLESPPAIVRRFERVRKKPKKYLEEH